MPGDRPAILNVSWPCRGEVGLLSGALGPALSSDHVCCVPRRNGSPIIQFRRPFDPCRIRSLDRRHATESSGRTSRMAEAVLLSRRCGIDAYRCVNWNVFFWGRPWDPSPVILKSLRRSASVYRIGDGPHNCQRTGRWRRRFPSLAKKFDKRQNLARNRPSVVALGLVFEQLAWATPMR